MVVDFRFKTGRIDCGTSPSTNELYAFPSPFLNNQDLVGFFRDKYGFNAAQTAAIMGKHI